MPIVPIHDLDDSRLDDYRNVRERQWAAEFRAAGPGEAPQAARAAADSPADARAPFGKLMAEGDVVVEHLASSGLGVLSALTTPARAARVLAMLARPPAEEPAVYTVPEAVMTALVGFPLHRGLLAVAARPRPRGLDELLAAGPGPDGSAAPLLAALEDLTNHDNVGAAFRNAAAFGARGLLLSPRCADPLYRKALRVSVGHALRVPWAWAHPWPEALARARRAGLLVVALATDPRARDVADVDPLASGARGVVVLAGSEGPGLTPAALGGSDVVARIPMARGVDSLNVGVALAIALHTFARRLGTNRSPDAS